MTITRSRTLSLINLTVDGTQMETVHSTRYIAVTISSDLTQGLHITNTYKKAKQQLGLTYRKFHQASHQVRSKLYSNIVLPKLEYCSSVWDPHQVKYISKLDMLSPNNGNQTTPLYLITSKSLLYKVTGNNIMFFKILNDVTSVSASLFMPHPLPSLR